MALDMPIKYNLLPIGKGRDQSSYVESSWCVKKPLVIKERYYSRPVVCLGYGVFSYNIFTSAYVPPTITIMKSLAFHCCRRLDTINMPDTFISISSSCFRGDDKLSHIIVRFGKSDDWFGTVIRIFKSFNEDTQ